MKANISIDYDTFKVKSIVLLLIIFLSLNTFAQQNDWENPAVNQINKLPARATFYSYENAKPILICII